MIPVSQPSIAVQFWDERSSSRVAQSYRESLSPWCIVQHLPQCQRKIIARFRRRNDASAHLKALLRLHPEAHYEIVFDPSID